MEAVQALLSSNYSKNNIGIYVKDLTTETEAGVNQDKIFYSASIAKLPIYTMSKSN